MKTPVIRYMEELQDWDTTRESSMGEVCIRPYAFGGLHILWRLNLAWLVFTGKCDALEWHPEGEQ
jgi:hypothetical protein